LCSAAFREKVVCVFLLITLSKAPRQAAIFYFFAFRQRAAAAPPGGLLVPFLPCIRSFRRKGMPASRCRSAVPKESQCFVFGTFTFTMEMVSDSSGPFFFFSFFFCVLFKLHAHSLSSCHLFPVSPSPSPPPFSVTDHQRFLFFSSLSFFFMLSAPPPCLIFGGLPIQLLSPQDGRELSSSFLSFMTFSSYLLQACFFSTRTSSPPPHLQAVFLFAADPPCFLLPFGYCLSLTVICGTFLAKPCVMFFFRLIFQGFSQWS